MDCNNCSVTIKLDVTLYMYNNIGDILKEFKLQAGDDAGAVRWMAATSKLNLYASHLDFIHKTVEFRRAAW